MCQLFVEAEHNSSAILAHLHEARSANAFLTYDDEEDHGETLSALEDVAFPYLSRESRGGVGLVGSVTIATAEKGSPSFSCLRKSRGSDANINSKAPRLT